VRLRGGGCAVWLALVVLLPAAHAAASINVSSFQVAWQNSSDVMLEFWMANTGDENLSVVNWSLGFGDGVYRNSVRNLTLLTTHPENDAVVYARYNYSAPGNYLANATARSGSVQDIENLTVRVEGGPSFAENLTNQTIAAQQELVYDINCTDPNDDQVTYSDNTTLFEIDSLGVIRWTPSDADVDNRSIAVTCTSQGGSATQGFRIGVKPRIDIEVRNSDIQFSNNNPGQGQVFTIYADVWNRGSSAYSGTVRVRFYNSSSDANLIGEFNLSDIPSGQNRTASMNWSHQAAGIHLIRVVANTTTPEATVENNEAKRAIAIGGTSVGDILITSSSVSSPIYPSGWVTVSGDTEYDTNT